MKIPNNTPTQIKFHELPDELSDDQNTQETSAREEPNEFNEKDLTAFDEDIRKIFDSSDESDREEGKQTMMHPEYVEPSLSDDQYDRMNTAELTHEPSDEIVTDHLHPADAEPTQSEHHLTICNVQAVTFIDYTNIPSDHRPSSPKGSVNKRKKEDAMMQNKMYFTILYTYKIPADLFQI